MVLIDTSDNTLVKRENRLRYLAGGLSTSDLSNADADEFLNRGDEWMENATGAWVDTLDDANLRIQAAEQWAAAEVLDGIPTDAAARKATEFRTSAHGSIARINKKTVEGGAAVFQKTKGFNNR
mgnify:CR=1 FL=1